MARQTGTRSRAASCAGKRAVGQFPGQRGSLDVLHREVRLPVALADLKDRHDVRVRQPRRRQGLDPEPLEFGSRRFRPAQQPLECDDPAALDLTRPRNDPHAASSQLLEKLVLPESAAERIVRIMVRSRGRSRGARLGRRAAMRVVSNASARRSYAGLGLARFLAAISSAIQTVAHSDRRSCRQVGMPGGQAVEVGLLAPPHRLGELFEQRSEQRVLSVAEARVARLGGCRAALGRLS